MANILKLFFLNSIKYWYISIIHGIGLITLGIYIYTSPNDSYLEYSFVFSISFIIAGLLEIFFAMLNSDSLIGWQWYVLSGLVSLMAGTLLSLFSIHSIIILTLVIGLTMLFRWFYLLGVSSDLKDAKIASWVMLRMLSIFGVVLSFCLLVNPIFGGVSIVILTAFLFIFSGICSITISFDLKNIKQL